MVWWGILAACLTAQSREAECPPGEADERTCLGLPAEDVAAPAAPTDQNIRGEALEGCSVDPVTGFFRDGTCRTGPSDRGVHVVCAEVTDDFLSYSRAQGNDLITPSPAHGFPGLEAGDRWCLCAARWEEARQAGVAPPIVAAATHARALDIVPAGPLRAAAID